MTNFLSRFRIVLVLCLHSRRLMVLMFVSLECTPRNLGRIVPPRIRIVYTCRIWTVCIFFALEVWGLMCTMRSWLAISTSARKEGMFCFYDPHTVNFSSGNTNDNFWRNRILFSFHWAHIWSCPPGEGDDYIFHCHPVDQKIPKQKRLVEWYKKMLDKLQSDSIIVEYKVSLLNIYFLVACTRLCNRKNMSDTTIVAFRIYLHKR